MAIPPPPPPPLGDAEEELGVDLIRAAMKGKVKIFEKPNLSNEHFFRKTSGENNILHIAVRYEQKEFVRAFLKKYFSINKKLISERNSQGNTPLHVAAEVGNKVIVMVLFNYMKKSVEGGHEGDDEKPWRAQNSKGNTALHVALLCGNDDDVAEFLVKRDSGLARIVNNSQEAPLHLAITHLTPYVCERMTSVLLKKARCVASWRDAKGFTPLLRAASLNSYVILSVIKKIIDVCPASTLVVDASDKSFLHLLIHNKLLDHKRIEDLICLNEIRILKDHQDQDGNTPLHVAAKCENLRIVRSLQSKCSAYPFITNSDGISAWSMIEQLNLSHQPPEPRSMTPKEYKSACKGDINDLLESKRTNGLEFLASQWGRTGSNFLHHLMNTKAIHHYFSSVDDRRKFLTFIYETLNFFPQLVCQTNKSKNTPVHILARLRKPMADPTLWDSSLLSNLLSICANAITRIKSRSTTANEADNHDLPWVMQNSDGNTPLHEAIIANNKVMVLELLRYSEESARVVNKHGETPLHLLAGTDNGMEEFSNEEIIKMVKANSEALGLPDKNGLIPLSRAVKAKNLNVVVTLLCNAQEFCDTNGQTLWHLFLKNQLSNFLDDLLQNEAFRKILKQKDKDGNTPLHLAMKEKCFDFVGKILETWGRKQEISEGEKLESNEWLMDLLRMHDKDGLTPVIRAVKVDNLDLAKTLCRVSPEAAKMGDIDGKTIWHLLPKHPSYKSMNVKDLLQNEELRKVLKQTDDDGNTPLHLAIKEKCFGFVRDLLESWKSESESSEGKQLESNQWLMDLLKIPDNEGLTPIVRAIKADNLDLATELCFVSPEATKLGETDGKTFWHFIIKHPSFNSAKKVNELLKIVALRDVVLVQKDKDGNTPLHIAIKEKCFIFVHDLLETCKSESKSSEGNKWLMDLLKIPNNVGETPEDLLADLPALSPELEEQLLTDRRMKGIRSSWGIPRTQLQNYMSSMNVIAALQTTITFTAAFTVPGGLIQDIGTPILIRSIAFQVFMISDVIAMCLSMMVLICLLWMVATTSKRESVLIQDFALSLLLASFVATLTTFMSGVYATIFPVKPCIAITTLVLCSFLMLFVHKFMVTRLLLPFKNATSNFVHMFLGPPDEFCPKLLLPFKNATSKLLGPAAEPERNIV